MKRFLLCFVLSLTLFFPIKSSASQSLLPGLIRVGLERWVSNASRITIENTHLSVGYNVNGAFSPMQSVQSASGFTVVVEAGGRMNLYSGSQIVLHLDDSANAIQIRDGSGGHVMLNNSPYMNTVELYRPSKGNITAVNVLTPDEYLYSIVLTEMAEDFHIEALKAQSIAARNYLFTRLRTHESQGYHVCDSGHCLLYRGANRNKEIGIRAVDETSGQMIYSQGQPINATFFSSSGGTTDNAENVWSEAVPYLRGVSDTVEHEPPVWTRSFTWNDLTNLLVANNISIGAANNVAVTKIGAGGRVLELTISASSGQKVLEKEEIRSFFSPSEEGELDSRNFTVTGGAGAALQVTTLTATNGVVLSMAPGSDYYALSAYGEPFMLNAQPNVYNLHSMTSVNGGSGVTFSGSGWGHGVGLSQRGAEGLARQGYTYRDILLHYYTGVEIY
jgi:stage II sporulation protein D